MSTDRIYQRYLAAIQDAAESLTPADLGAVRLGLRLALADAQAEQAARTGELSDIAAQAVAERAAALQQVADLEQQLLLLQTLEDRLTAWLTHHEPAIAEQFDGDPGGAIIHILDHRRVVTVNVTTPAQQDHLHQLAERVASTIASGTTVHTNSNGKVNGVVPTHYPPAGGATVSPPPSIKGRRFNCTDDELRTAAYAVVRQHFAETHKSPTLQVWNDTYVQRFGLPTVSGLVKRLGVKWGDFCAAALASTTSTTTEQEAPADAPATFRG